MAKAGSSSSAWRHLAERESARLDFAFSPPPRYPTPAHVFYSVQNSLRNKRGNRYSNILAYDRTAVQVGDEEGYLNANVVCDERGQWWVASQAPTEETMHAFFRAIYTGSASRHPSLLVKPQTSRDGKRRAILVQLTGWEENGMPKASPYLPESVPGIPRSFHSPSSSSAVHVHPHSRTPLPNLHSVRTDLTVAGDEEDEMQLAHYHFEAWPDHGVPSGEAVEALRGLVHEIGRQREEWGGDACEVWVHCSAGVGRTGTFIALSSLLLQAEPAGARNTPRPETLPPSPLGPFPEALQGDDVARTVDSIREWRGMMVQNQDQLRLIYQMVG